MLKNLLSKEFISLNEKCKDWKDAIRSGCFLLERKNCVDDSYKEAIIDSFIQNGSYMVIAPGIVLAHARWENGVKKMSMSLVTLKDALNFGSETNDPVKLIVTLAAIDNKSHLKALSQLMELFMNERDMETIMKATSKDEVLKVIETY